jgi:hypothetical protein
MRIRRPPSLTVRSSPDGEVIKESQRNETLEPGIKIEQNCYPIPAHDGPKITIRPAVLQCSP